MPDFTEQIRELPDSLEKASNRNTTHSHERTSDERRNARFFRFKELCKRVGSTKALLTAPCQCGQTSFVSFTRSSCRPIDKYSQNLMRTRHVTSLTCVWRSYDLYVNKNSRSLCIGILYCYKFSLVNESDRPLHTHRTAHFSGALINEFDVCLDLFIYYHYRYCWMNHIVMR